MSRPAVFFLLIIAPAFSLCLALLGLETLAENRLGWFLLVLGISYPAGGVIHYFVQKQPFWEATGAGKPVKRDATDRSFWAILPGFILTLFAPPIQWHYLRRLPGRSLDLEIAGWLFLVAGLAVTVWARYSLREYYSGKIQVGSNQSLIQTGPYRVLRHPAYAGMLLIALGIALGYASWIGLAAFIVLLLPALVYRISIEEKLLSEQFGPEFDEFKRHTKKLVPGIW